MLAFFVYTVFSGRCKPSWSFLLKLKSHPVFTLAELAFHCEYTETPKYFLPFVPRENAFPIPNLFRGTMRIDHVSDKKPVIVSHASVSSPNPKRSSLYYKVECREMTPAAIWKSRTSIPTTVL